jgi:LemA protein
MVLYNALVRARLGVREAWSAVDVQLQRRLDLIPNLIETVEGYARHERDTLERVVRARNALQEARAPRQAGEANAALTRALGGIFALAEAYPQLRANENFRDMQAQLAETEDKVAYARNYYNSRVLAYNEQVATIPAAFVAGTMGFRAEEFFEGDEAARSAPRVRFGGSESSAE